MKRLIIAMGMGVSAESVQDAAQKAVDQALMHASLDILKTLEIAPGAVQVKATIGVQTPEALRASDVTVSLSESAEINVVFGGQAGPSHVATAAVEVFLPKQTGWKLQAY